MAEDVRYYGKWMRDEAEKRIGHLYPKIEVTAELAQERPDLKPYVGRKLTVIAWLWARTVKSPNPAFAHVDVPLVSSFVLSTKSGKEAYVDPVIENDGYRFTVKVGPPPPAAKSGTKIARGSFRCLFSDVPIRYEYIDDEANAGRMSERLMAVVAEGNRGRVYLPPTQCMESIAYSAQPTWRPDAPSRGTWASNAQGRRYGFKTFGDYFTDRQLVALTTFSDLVGEARERVRQDAVAAGMPDDGTPLRDGGDGAKGYADAVGVYLGMAVSKLSDAQSSLCRWKASMTQSIGTFGRQALPMVWDFSEANTFGGMAGDLITSLTNMMKVVDQLPSSVLCSSQQVDAVSQTDSVDKLVSTDPPYYDNVGYADLSDYFYVWLRHTLRDIYSDLFATLEVPKAEELVATPYRHGSRQKAEVFFLEGMTRAMRCLAGKTHSALPVTIYYAFKQSEQSNNGVTSSGWETFLGAVRNAGFSISGTWPVRTEMRTRQVGMNTNALASSIVLVCRPQAANVPTATRWEFLDALRSELPEALRKMQQGNIAPVDLAQAAIGPGMSIFTRYARVLDSGGSAISVREALALINETLDEVLAEQEGDFDADTRWALAWFEQSGFSEGEYGVAETLSTAKNTSVAGMVGSGHSDLWRRARCACSLLLSCPRTGTRKADSRRTVWETTHHLVRVHEQGGDTAAADIMANIGADAETARDLAYRLYRICDKRNRPQEALGYNALVRSWGEISGLATQARQAPTEPNMFDGE